MADYKENNAADFDYISGLDTTVDFILGGSNPHYDPEIKKTHRHGHQFRITYPNLHLAIEALKDLDASVFSDFEQLFREVTQRTQNVPRYLQLHRYDFCLRCGAKAGIEPKDIVYFHAGAYRGARSLVEAGLVELELSKLQAPVDLFPEPLRQLGSAHIENFLCVNHDNLLLLENVYRARSGKKPRYDGYTEHQAKQSAHAGRMRERIDFIFAKVKSIK
ncbi:MAG: hypothetical protein K2H74_02210 [Paramuribaculum sp.]|nr:hypothetical protein [Paramuribaculum sp.]